MLSHQQIPEFLVHEKGSDRALSGMLQIGIVLEPFASFFLFCSFSVLSVTLLPAPKAHTHDEVWIKVEIKQSEL